MARDYYKTLGVAQNATKDEIKKAYRSLAHKYHPDKGGDEARFKEINEAYQILSDDKKRSQYDQFGQVFEGGSGFRQGGFEWPGGFRFDFGGDASGGFHDFDFSDVFEDFLGANVGGKRRSGEKRGKDIKLDLMISFHDSILGGKQEIEFSKLSRCARCGGSGGEPGSRMSMCNKCQGRGNVQKTQRTFLGPFTQVATCSECLGSGKRPENLCKQCRGKGVEERLERFEIFVPKGVRDGDTLKISGKGEASLSGGVPGDLYTSIHVTPDARYKRQEDAIVMHMPISLSTAILGETIDIETLDGTLRLKIPEGTQPGDILKVRGKGAYVSSGYGRGDLLIEIKVELPKKLNKKTKEFFEQLKKEEN